MQFEKIQIYFFPSGCFCVKQPKEHSGFSLRRIVQLGYGGRNTQEESFRTELFVRLSRLIHAAS